MLYDGKSPPCLASPWMHELSVCVWSTTRVIVMHSTAKYSLTHRRLTSSGCDERRAAGQAPWRTLAPSTEAVHSTGARADIKAERCRTCTAAPTAVCGVVGPRVRDVVLGCCLAAMVIANIASLNCCHCSKLLTNMAATFCHLRIQKSLRSQVCGSHCGQVQVIFFLFT